MVEGAGATLVPVVSARATILCYGDSLTAGFTTPFDEFEPWAPILADRLGVECNHVGLSGWTTDQMLMYIDDSSPNKADALGLRRPGLNVLLRAAPKPSHVILMAGTNDLFRSPAEKIAANLIRMHDTVLAAGCKSIALTIPQSVVANKQPSADAKRREINQMLRAYAESKRGECLFVAMDEDVPASDGSPEWQPDGLHMSKAGYRRFGAVLSGKIAAFVSDTTPMAPVASVAASDEPALSVGTLVLVDGSRAGELACENDGGTWDVMYDDDTEEDAVDAARITRRPVQRQRQTDDELRATLTAVLAASDGGASGAGALQPQPQRLKHPLPALDRRAELSQSMACVRRDASSGGSVWLGDRKASSRAEWLRECAIGAVVNVTDELPNLFEHEGIVEYHSVRLEDTACDETVEAMAGALDGAIDFIDAHVRAGKGVLVHCFAGRSRSATVVLAYLMRVHGLSLAAAVEQTQRMRACLPNEGFWRLLRERELATRGGGDQVEGITIVDHATLRRRFVSDLCAASVAMPQTAGPPREVD